MSDLKSQANELINSLTTRTSAHGITDGQSAIKSVDELRAWLHFYQSHATTKNARELLDGTQAAILESIGYITLGLGRAALSAIRTQIDLLLCFTYFSDHPREWSKVTTSGDGFKLRSDIYAYHKDMDKKFGARLTMIEQVSQPTLEDIYRTLSAHIHGQAPLTMPSISKISQLVSTEETIGSILDIQHKSSIALSNFLVAIHASEWTSLPKPIIDRVRALLSEKQRPQFFE